MSAVLDLDAFLQMLPDADVLRTHAESVKSAGQNVESVADSAGQVWSRLQGGGMYSAPGENNVFSAFAPILTRANDVSIAAVGLGLAMKSYADEVDDIRQRFEAEVRPAAESLAMDTAGRHVTEWDDDGDLVDRHNAIISQINKFVGELDAAQRACARELGRVRAGSKCEPTEPNGNSHGYGLAYGKGLGVVPADAGPLTAGQLDLAAEVPGQLPWGSLVEHDLGFDPVTRGMLDSLVFEPYEAFETLTGRRGKEAQITAVQGLWFLFGAATGKSDAAEGNRRQILLDMAHVDLFKRDPQRAIGRLTVDLGSLLIPAGWAAKAGKIGATPAHVDGPSSRLEVTVPPAPGIKTLTEARPGLIDQLGKWAERNVLSPEPAYPGGAIPGRHQFDVAPNEAPEGSPGAGSGGTGPESPPKYGVQIPEQSNPNGPGRNPAMQPSLGDSDHGPGHWKDEHSDPRGRDYQKYITGVDLVDGRAPEYVVDYDHTDLKTGEVSRRQVKMDGFYWEKGPPPVQVHQEGKGHYEWMQTRFKDTTIYESTLVNMIDGQFTNQVDALIQSGDNSRLEWHFQEQSVADDFFELVVAPGGRFKDLIANGRIVIKWTPMP